MLTQKGTIRGCSFIYFCLHCFIIFLFLFVLTCSYSLVKRIDSQLAQMGKDLTDVIEQMNAANPSDQEDDHVSYALYYIYLCFCCLSVQTSPNSFLSFSFPRSFCVQFLAVSLMNSVTSKCKLRVSYLLSCVCHVYR